MNAVPPTFRSARRGGAMLLSIIAVGVALLIAMSLLMTASRATSTSATLHELTLARLESESALEATLAYVERAESFTSLPAGGQWIGNWSLNGGSAGVFAEWPNGWGGYAATIANPSFEAGAGSLASPLLNPPMSGTLGNWNVVRTALVVTGLTVPQMEIVNSPFATDGSQAARIRFGASVTGSGVFRQTVAAGLTPNSHYTCEVDVFTSGLPALNASFGVRIYAGSTLLVSTEEALTLFDHLTSEQIQATAQSLLQNALTPATLLVAPLGQFIYGYTLSFQTSDAPPPGAVTIELFAESLGLASHVGFDNVRLQWTSQSSLRLTATGQSGTASRRVVALYGTDLAGRGRVLRWQEP